MPLTPIASHTHMVNGPARFILFGEDDPDDEEFLREIFHSVDPSIILRFVNTGRKVIVALDRMSAESLPSLIVLDYNMPELNGADILRELKRNARYAAIPKVIWSTSGSDVYRTICLSLGADEYFTKASNLGELTIIASKMLAFC